MVSLNRTARTAAPQTPPIVGELERLFDNLDDSRLIDLLVGPTRRGPKGHPTQALWRAFITKHYMGLSSTRDLIRTLSNNPWIANACGFDWPDIPHEATFSRFFGRLAWPMFLPLVKDVSRRLVRKHAETLPGFGKRVAIDSSVVKAWANGGKPVKSDPDAAWAVKKNTHGKNEFTFGYKLHLLVDCETELPMAANVTPGDVHDVNRATNVLRDARKAYRGFHPQYFMADAGYSSRQLNHHVRRQYNTKPIIKVNKGHKRLMSEFRDAMNEPWWKALYNQRQGVERAFSRLKGQRSLNHVTTRGWRKVTLHCYLALLAMQAGHLPASSA